MVREHLSQHRHEHAGREMAAWRPMRQKIRRQYAKAYFAYFPIFAAEDDHDDRNLLYYLAKETMRTLLAKYPDGYEGWPRVDKSLFNACTRPPCMNS
ncbi:uncharacterized protein J7T55_015138 [Diaporthe amygdali]|uniref:uncharacterized protein n=1 Tax=Phomopsis amygdali TaxID=1214568 RepID=UPI0022FEBB32|nr:uncharacterized protein J7T55_015138 [Diaporthe amygdali]KAJ0120411.1 uncharacterized protein J7T55_015138 [Diaporthe amygdali]